MTDFKPGDVCVATVRGVPNVRVMACPDMRLALVHPWTSAVSIQGTRMHACEDVTDVRRLVVLDLDAHMYDASLWQHFADKVRFDYPSVADQIEAQTRPPKPPEPTGLGAVVKDREGHMWVRCPVEGDVTQGEWVCAHSTARMFSALDAVEVLSEGVTP